jgi:hypothetical protein
MARKVSMTAATSMSIGHLEVQASHDAQSHTAFDDKMRSFSPNAISRMIWLERRSVSLPTGHPAEHL